MIRLNKSRRADYHLGLIFGIFILISFAQVLSPAGAASQSESVQIIEIDDYSKSARAGESVTYNWTLRNLDPIENLTVDISGSITGENWDYVLSNDSLVIPAGELDSITVSVMIPAESGDASSNLTVTFSVLEHDFLVQVSSVNAITSLYGAFVSAEKVLGHFENPLPAPLNNEWGVFLLDIIIWFLLATAIAYLIDGIGRLLTRKTATMLERIIIGILRTPLLLLIFVYGVVQSLDALHMHIPEDMRQTLISLYNVMAVIVIFYLAYKIFKNVLVYYGNIIAKRTASRVDDILVPVIEKVGIIIIAMAAFAYVLSALDIDLTMFVAGGMFLSFVIAFAAQETLSNFFSGIFILLDRPFTEGDIVILSDGDWCEVRQIGFRTTKLFRFSDASLVAIPNNKLVNDKIANFTSLPDKGRVMMTFGVSYDSDVDKVKGIIREVIEACPWILKDDPDLKPIVRFDEMADSSINFFILVWLHERADRFNTKDFLNTNIFKRFSEEGIEIPFPQRVVHMKNE